MLCLWNQVPGDPSGVAPGSSLSGQEIGAVLGPVHPSVQEYTSCQFSPVTATSCSSIPLLFPLIRSCPTPGSPSHPSLEHLPLPHPLFNHSSISHSLSTCAGQVHTVTLGQGCMDLRSCPQGASGCGQACDVWRVPWAHALTCIQAGDWGRGQEKEIPEGRCQSELRRGLGEVTETEVTRLRCNLQ